MDSKLSRRKLIRAFGHGAIASILPIGYADLGADWLATERHDLQLPAWDADGFRVAVVSDIHANSAREAAAAATAFRIAVDESPDLIAVPGDFANGSDAETLKHVKAALAPLKDAKCPVIGTMGNHDYWTRDPSKIVRGVGDWGVKLLRNEAVEVQGVTVFGVDDAIAERHRPDKIREGSYSKSLLTLFHEPDFVEDVPGVVSLQISGHSHGGQICLPGGISVHTPRGARKYIAGFYPDAKVPLYVSRGVGTVGPRLRLFCRPEVSILTLRSM